MQVFFSFFRSFGMVLVAVGVVVVVGGGGGGSRVVGTWK